MSVFIQLSLMVDLNVRYSSFFWFIFITKFGFKKSRLLWYQYLIFSKMNFNPPLIGLYFDRLEFNAARPREFYFRLGFVGSAWLDQSTRWVWPSDSWLTETFQSIEHNHLSAISDSIRSPHTACFVSEIRRLLYVRMLQGVTSNCRKTRRNYKAVITRRGIHSKHVFAIYFVTFHRELQ